LKGRIIGLKHDIRKIRTSKLESISDKNLTQWHKFNRRKSNSNTSKHEQDKNQTSKKKQQRWNEEYSSLKTSENWLALNTNWWGRSFAGFAGKPLQLMFYRLKLAECEGNTAEDL